MPTYNDALAQFIDDVFVAEDETLKQVRETLSDKGLPAISIRPVEGHFLMLLARMVGATRMLEIGTLGGYSGTWLARGMAPGGRLITVEKSSKHAAVATANFAATGVSDRVEVRVGEARQLLPKLAAEAPFDLVFIDADKANYRLYFDWAADHVRVGGVVAAHNAFRGGRLLDAHPDAETLIVRQLNEAVGANPALEGLIYPAGDGMLVAVRTA